MAKFYGLIGFSQTVESETSPGVYVDQVVPKEYYGDFERQGRRWEKGESINDDLVINNYVSIVADDFAMENLGYMKWVEISGNKWKIVSVELDYPRIKITLGGVWNGE